MVTPEDPTKRPLPRPFQNVPVQEPFYRTKEFRLFSHLAVGLVLVALFGAYLLWPRTKSSPTVEPHAAALPKHELTDGEKAERETLLLTKFEGALTDTKNGEDFRQSPGYWKLLETLVHFTPEEVHDHVTKDLTWTEAMADPESLRGEFVRVRGILGDHWALKLGRPVLGRMDVWRAQISDGDEIFYFDAMEWPKQLDVAGAIDVEGIFYRTVRYEARGPQGPKGDYPQKAQKEVPYLLVRNILNAPTNADTGEHAFLEQYGLYVLAGLAFVIFGGALLIFLVRNRTKRVPASELRGASFQEMFAKKLREDGRTPPPQV